MSASAFLISCSDHYHHRLHVWDNCLRSRGYETQYVTSNFDHDSKQAFVCNVPGCVQLPVRPYRKNLSAERIFSHREFAKSVKDYLDKHTPKVIVAILPPNYLAHYLAKYKKSHPDTVLIFDIFDLWPETFPSGKVKKLLAPLFSVWAGLRDKNLSAADYVTTECELFRKNLALKDAISTTVHLCDVPLTIQSEPHLSAETLSLCYLGAINNVIGIDEICDLISKISIYKPVQLHIIGRGERLQQFIDSAKEAGAEVIYHGCIYDPAEKMKILDGCHFGLNIMKSSVCVGLTMKSVDYFRYGLPIINNIPADTAELIESYGAGVPLDANCCDRLFTISQEQCLEMRKNAWKAFHDMFTVDLAMQKLNQILDKITG